MNQHIILLPVCALMVLTSCSKSLYDVRYSSHHSSATGLMEDSVAARRNSAKAKKLPEPEPKTRQKESGGAYLTLVNIVRAPFIPLLGGLEALSLMFRR